MSDVLSSLDATTRAAVEGVQRDGIAGLPQSLPTDWVEELEADFRQLFAEARSYPEGTIGRGPHRYYFAVHPERLRGFVDLVTHPVVDSICESMLGAGYQVVEVAFDVPLPGAVDQPWHRDFPIPDRTRDQHELTSLAFNVTTVDVTPQMAPFEIAPGTHWDTGAGFDHGMFAPPEAAAGYTERGERRHPRRGDMSVRTGLTLHRGTANHSDTVRAVLVLGVVTAELAAEEAGGVHDLVVTRGYHAALPEQVRRHLRCTVVEELTPIIQQHDIEGLVMG